MVDLSSYKKADLVEVAQKVGVNTVSKDTKKSLIEKLEAYIEVNGEAGLDLVEEGDDDDAETLAEEGEVKEGDDEYKGPPIDLKAWIVDPVLEITEPYYAQFLDWSDNVYLQVSDLNDEVREKISSVIYLNYLELVLELAVFLYTYVPVTNIKHSHLIHPVIKDLLPEWVLTCKYIHLPELTYLLDFKVLSILINWVVYSVVVPLIASYYINFTRKTYTINIGGDDYEEDDEDEEEEEDDFDDEEDDAIYYTVRTYDFDPVIFSLLKILIFYFITTQSGNLSLFSSVGGILKALGTQVLIQFGIYKEFTVVLGNFPLVLGLANLVIGVYSQFEDY